MRYKSPTYSFCVKILQSSKEEVIAVEFLPYKDRCALPLSELGLPMTRERVIEVLGKRGFKKLPVDFSTMIELARKCVGKSEYRCARPALAPQVVDCATLLVWVYGQRGIALPRHPIAQRKVGRSVSLTEVKIGDLVFSRHFRRTSFKRLFWCFCVHSRRSRS